MEVLSSTIIAPDQLRLPALPLPRPAIVALLAGLELEATRFEGLF
jgi:hypothetical protein